MDERLYRMRLMDWALRRGDDYRTGYGDGRVPSSYRMDKILNRIRPHVWYFGRDVWAFPSGVL